MSSPPLRSALLSPAVSDISECSFPHLPLSSKRAPPLTFLVPVTYQLGNMISSPSAQIVNAIAESHLITGAGGKRVPSYGPTMGIATAIIALGIIVTAALGREKRGSHFENAVIGGDTTAGGKEDMESGKYDKEVEMDGRMESVDDVVAEKK